MLTSEECIWIDYATYDEVGFISGVRDDAPDNVKKAYEEHQKELQKHRNNGTMIPK